MVGPIIVTAVSYVAVAFFTGAIIVEDLVDGWVLPTDEADFVAKFALGLFWPLTLVVALLYLLAVGAKIVVRGSRDLYRMWRPKKPEKAELPKMEVL